QRALALRGFFAERLPELGDGGLVGCHEAGGAERLSDSDAAALAGPGDDIDHLAPVAVALDAQILQPHLHFTFSQNSRSASSSVCGTLGTSSLTGMGLSPVRIVPSGRTPNTCNPSFRAARIARWMLVWVAGAFTVTGADSALLDIAGTRNPGRGTTYQCVRVFSAAF